MVRAVTIAFLLTGIAGYVDAVGYLSFGKIYTANMSGNSVAVGISLGEGDWWHFFERLWPVVLYVLGLFWGRILLAAGARRKIERIASIGFCTELVLVACTIVASHSQVASIAFLAFAMGLQNAILTHFSFLTVHTGFVTGTLVRMVEEAVRYGSWLWDRTAGGKGSLHVLLRESLHQKCFQTFSALLGIWTVYVFGAALGVLAILRIQVFALLYVVPFLLSMIAVDLRFPLAIQEEAAQARRK